MGHPSVSDPPDVFVSEVRERVAACTRTVEKLGGAVRVSVAPGGAAVELVLTERALEPGASALANAIREAARQAGEQARRAYDQVAVEVLGTGRSSALNWLPEPGSVISARVPGEMSRYTAGVTGKGTGADGDVRVTVGPSGDLEDLRIEPGALQAGPDRLSGSIRVALGQAMTAGADEMARRRREAGPPGVVGVDTILARVRDGGQA